MKRLSIISFLFLLITLDIFSQSGWFQQTSGTIARLNSCFFINSNTGCVITQDGNVIKTLNGGSIWANSQNLSSNNLYGIFFIDQFTGWIAGRQRVWKTTNSGINWNTNDTIAGGYLNSLYFINNNTGWVVGDYAIRKTTNGGLNWFSQWHFDNILSHDLNSISFTNANTGLIVGCCEIKKTTDGGTTWIDVDTTTNPLYSLYSINTNQCWAVGSGGSIYKSTNTGNNWYPVLSGVSKTFNSVFFLDINTGWIAGGTYNDSDGVILKTTNAGVNWVTQTNPLIKNLREIFFVNGNTGWAVGENGTILKTTTGGNPIGIEPISNTVPNQFSLSQNYPNPFNPSTEIEFDIPERTNTELIVYDAVGKEVAVLVNEVLNAGRYRVSFGGTYLSSGLYFFRLITDKYSETRRMVLLK